MIWPENTLKETEIGVFQFLLSEGYKRNDQRQESSGTERQVKDQSMMLSVPDITLTSSCNSLEPSRFRTRRASFQAFKTSGSRGHDFPPTPPRNHIPRFLKRVGLHRSLLLRCSHSGRLTAEDP